MLYPVFSYSDGTEVTASRPDENGRISIYVEKFDAEQNAFKNVTIILPDANVVASSGYSESELASMLEEYSRLKDDIIGYVREKCSEEN